MKAFGIIILILAVTILLIGIISPINIFVCTLIAAILFLIGAIFINKFR